MSKKTWVILAIVIIAVVVPVAIALSHSSSSPSDSTPQSQNATDLTLPTMAGANITLSELKGTPVVLNFWSISCPYCRVQLPYLEDVAQQSAGEIKVIAINMADNAASLQNFFGDYEPAMIVALDNNVETFVNYCQNYGNARGSIPFTLFVDSEGLVQYVKIGAFASEAELWNTLHSVLGITVP
jgi:thiol-disulfide isomerase/thioredoxin